MAAKDIISLIVVCEEPSDNKTICVYLSVGLETVHGPGKSGNMAVIPHSWP